MNESAYLDRLVLHAKEALHSYEAFSQQAVDACIQAMCAAMRDHAAELAEMAVAETGYGDIATKTHKNAQAADTIWKTLQNQKSVGVIGEDEKRRLVYVAKPVGVIAAITPSTNPSTTILFNACYALKGRNVVIFSAHPGAAKTSARTIDILVDALAAVDAPEHLLQYIDADGHNLSDELLARCQLSLVAGNEKTVKKGYCSGHPSIGVSHGNVQTIIDRGYDLETAIAESVESCAYDNGLICACTQAVLVPAESRGRALELFAAHHAAVLTQDRDIQKLRNLLFPDDTNFDRNYIGKSVQVLAEAAELNVPEDTSIILVAPDRFDPNDPLLMGEMAPVCLLESYENFEDALQLAARALEKDGAGHANVLYTNDPDRAKQMAIALPINRLLINQPAIYAANQQLCNGLSPTANLACGSWANNSFSENITFRHLINICRISWTVDCVEDCTTDTLWC